MNDKRSEERLVEARKQARKHMIVVAAGLRHLIGPVDGAGVLFGAGIELLASELGKAGAVAYLRDLASELEADGNGYHTDTLQ